RQAASGSGGCARCPRPWLRTSTCRRGEQVVRNLMGVRTTIGDRAEVQADNADVDVDGFLLEARILERPVVALDRFTEAFRDDPRRAEVIEVRNQETEFVAAEPRVQLRRAQLGGFLCDEVFGPHLLAEQAGDAVDDLV